MANDISARYLDLRPVAATNAVNLGDWFQGTNLQEKSARTTFTQEQITAINALTRVLADGKIDISEQKIVMKGIDALKQIHANIGEIRKSVIGKAGLEQAGTIEDNNKIKLKIAAIPNYQETLNSVKDSDEAIQAALAKPDKLLSKKERIVLAMLASSTVQKDHSDFEGEGTYNKITKLRRFEWNRDASGPMLSYILGNLENGQQFRYADED